MQMLKYIAALRRAEQSRAEQSRAEQSRAEQSRAEQSSSFFRFQKVLLFGPLPLRSKGRGPFVFPISHYCQCFWEK